MYRFLLKPSLIPNAGVGCFYAGGASQIPAGTKLDAGSGECFRKMTIDEIPDDFLKFCVLLDDGVTFLAPLSFHRMGVFWYTNHQRDPNAAFRDRTMFAIKPIEPGDEISLYYSDLLTHPKNLEWVSLSDI